MLVCSWLVAFWNRLCSPLTSNFKSATLLFMAAVLSAPEFAPFPVDPGDPLFVLWLCPPDPPCTESVSERKSSVMFAGCESWAVTRNLFKYCWCYLTYSFFHKSGWHNLCKGYIINTSNTSWCFYLLKLVELYEKSQVYLSRTIPSIVPSWFPLSCFLPVACWGWVVVVSSLTIEVRLITMDLNAVSL